MSFHLPFQANFSANFIAHVPKDLGRLSCLKVRGRVGANAEICFSRPLALATSRP